jgi:hypothetical protein
MLEKHAGEIDAAPKVAQAVAARSIPFTDGG